MERKKVLVIGDVSYDHIIKMDEFPNGEPSTYFASEAYYAIGGTAAGKALNLSKLGFDVTLCTKLASDDEGQKIINFMNTKDLNFIYEVDKDSSVTHTNLMNRNGERISIYTSNGDPNFKCDLDFYRNHIYISDYIVVNISAYVKQLLPMIKDSKKPIWVDIHDYDGKNQYYEDFIEVADVIFMSSDKLNDDMKYLLIMNKLIETGKKLVVCTHGKLGSEVHSSKNEKAYEDIIDSFEVIDTNGAGDAMFSGFLYGHANNQSLAKCLQYGTILGGLTVNTKEIANDKLSIDFLETTHRVNY